MKPFPSQLRRPASLVLLLGLLGAAYYLIIAPTAQRVAIVFERIDAERTLATRLQSSISAAQSLGGPARPDGATDWLITADSETIAAARLQGHARDIASRVDGLKFRSARSRAAVERDGVRLVGVELELTATTAQLMRVLVAFEIPRPVMIVDALQITSAQRPLLPEAASLVASDQLDVRLTLLTPMVATGSRPAAP